MRVMSVITENPSSSASTQATSLTVDAFSEDDHNGVAQTTRFSLTLVRYQSHAELYLQTTMVYLYSTASQYSMVRARYRVNY